MVDINTLGDLNALLELVREAHRKSEMSYQAIAERCGGRPDAGTIYRAINGQTRPRADTLFAIAQSLGVQPISDAQARTHKIAGFQLPVVAEGHANDTDREILFEPIELDQEDAVSYEGLVAVKVQGSSLLPLAANGQWVVCNPALHPDDAAAHPDFNAPIALVRLYDGCQLIKRWYHDREGKRVFLTTVNDSIRDTRGLPVCREVREHDVLDAWTVVGVRW